jgi:crotonobetainyl-CoA:carnitine CoA-transferase CaiB-like acyl-CoA transferase
MEKVKQMYKESDVVIDCFRPSVLEKLGLGPETAFNMNPKIIFCRISGFG